MDVAQLAADTGGLDLSAANQLLPRARRSVQLPAYRHTKDLPTEEIIDALRQQPGVSVEVDEARNRGVAYRLRYDG